MFLLQLVLTGPEPSQFSTKHLPSSSLAPLWYKITRIQSLRLHFTEIKTCLFIVLYSAANVTTREYQFLISKIALFTNTLVALPTGLGKTLIAAVVMLNYFRWFPEGKVKFDINFIVEFKQTHEFLITNIPFNYKLGKIIFAAPSRPLVEQQIEACHNIVGIPQVLLLMLLV